MHNNYGQFLTLVGQKIYVYLSYLFNFEVVLFPFPEHHFVLLAHYTTLIQTLH